MTFKTLRILILLVILALVIHGVFADRSRIASWKSPLWVVIYPHNADGSDSTARYIAGLDERHFAGIETFLADQARGYGLTLDRPFYVRLAGPVERVPPQVPDSGNVLTRALWVLKVRWWRLRFDEQGMDPDVVAIARYFDAAGNRSLGHSTGLERVRVAPVNLFASRAMDGQNRVVLAHEILHTVGATDLYDRNTGMPVFPTGYAEPDRNPLLPQRRAELMAGRIPTGPANARQARNLTETTVGVHTAREIGWQP